ncbi:hypothetical protein L596_019877 [Steinernema carpocapsae]|uniref:Uncharacterized protein n=1 Tax=Steinernema carpocapsae TaxID=34508 RepID=A0A4U5MRX2_STECR|nr:hypothetical protein L596_019877 [Steinernema carpocapsae]
MSRPNPFLETSRLHLSKFKTDRSLLPQPKQMKDQISDLCTEVLSDRSGLHGVIKMNVPRYVTFRDYRAAQKKSCPDTSGSLARRSGVMTPLRNCLV